MYFSDKLVDGVVGVSYGFRVSAFFVSVLFIGFDPENLFTGIAGSFEGVYGVVMGSIVGSFMVAVALAFGITILMSDVSFKKISSGVLIIPVLAPVLLYMLAVDGVLSRSDGFILIAAFIFSVVYLFLGAKKGIDVEVLHEPENILSRGKLLPLVILIVSLAGITAGSVMLVKGAKYIIAYLNVSETFFGMVVLALFISAEELARELPAAIRGRVDISYGNVAGSVLHFFLLNAGLISVLSPIRVDRCVVEFYLPVALLTIAFVSFPLARRSIPKWVGIVLIVDYFIFAMKGLVF